MSIRCLLWDFGGTLCDERFIWSSGPEWEEVYCLLDQGWGERWNTGELSDLEFAALAARYISMTPQEILEHMRERCKYVEFNEFTYSFYLGRTLPQAIVTVNPRLWSEVISPLYNFEQSADVIVTSWEEQTTDKTVLCDIALERLGMAHDRAESLLIDNKTHNIQSWQACGGNGYQFTTDERFQRDVADGIDQLSVPRGKLGGEVRTPTN